MSTSAKTLRFDVKCPRHPSEAVAFLATRKDGKIDLRCPVCMAEVGQEDAKLQELEEWVAETFRATGTEIDDIVRRRLKTKVEELDRVLAKVAAKAEEATSGLNALLTRVFENLFNALKRLRENVQTTLGQAQARTKNRVNEIRAIRTAIDNSTSTRPAMNVEYKRAMAAIAALKVSHADDEPVQLLLDRVRLKTSPKSLPGGCFDVTYLLSQIQNCINHLENNTATFHKAQFEQAFACAFETPFKQLEQYLKSQLFTKTAGLDLAATVDALATKVPSKVDIECVALLEDGNVSSISMLNERVFATAGDSTTIRFWDVGMDYAHFQSLGLSGTSIVAVKSISHLASLKGPARAELLGVGGDDEGPTVQVWDWLSGKLLAESSHAHRYGIMSLAVISERNEPSNRPSVLFASGSIDNTVKLWRVAVTAAPGGALEGELTCLHELIHHREAVSSLLVLRGSEAEETRLCVASQDHTISCWRVSRTKDNVAPRLISVRPAHHDRINVLCMIDEENGVFASGGGDCQIKIWDIDSGEPITTIANRKKTVWDLANLGDGLLAATANDIALKQYNVHLWNWRSRDLLYILRGHSGRILRIARLSNGNLVSAGKDKMIVVWRRTDPDKLFTSPSESPQNKLVISSK
eukprot:TRINITY_DN9677_c0_g1_i1.p1 TRINITY_DN9677_c0_g1~~TRINITY_DN9677_c0_g1_i1.p1  ORF type:complete len:639 (+),score=121.32 TRINITY_DN9677_c0_g1_i1:139-2055(+)